MDKRGKAAFFSDDDFTIEEATGETPPAPKPPREKETTPAEKEPVGNPLADMMEKKDIRKHCSFTLSPDSIKKIEKLAKQNKCSRSMALDLLIQKYL